MNKAQGIKILKDGKVSVEKDVPIGNIRGLINKCSASPRNNIVSAEVNKAQGIKVLKDGKVVSVEKDEPIGNI